MKEYKGREGEEDIAESIREKLEEHKKQEFSRDNNPSFYSKPVFPTPNTDGEIITPEKSEPDTISSIITPEKSAPITCEKHKPVPLAKPTAPTKEKKKRAPLIVLAIIIIVVLLGILAVFAFLFYGPDSSKPERTLYIEAGLENATVKNEETVYVKIAENINLEELAKLTIIFITLDNSEFIYEPEIVKREYEISASQLGVDNFKEIVSARVSFEYVESPFQINDSSTSTNQTINQTNQSRIVRGGGGGGGAGGDSGGGCTPNCAGKHCGSNGCGGTCGTCNFGYECNLTGNCAFIACTNDTRCDIKGQYCNGNISYNCTNTDLDICLERVNLTECRTGYLCVNSTGCYESRNCTADSNCTYLNNVTCNINRVTNQAGICSNFNCVANSSVIRDCDSSDSYFCSGTNRYKNEYSCLVNQCFNQSVLMENCNDTLFCNGEESCAGGSCTSGSAPQCDDSFLCTIDSCNELEKCTHAVNNSACLPTQFCDIAKGCVNSPVCLGIDDSCGIYPSCTNCSISDNCYVSQRRDYFCNATNGCAYNIITKTENLTNNNCYNGVDDDCDGDIDSLDGGSNGVPEDYISYWKFEGNANDKKGINNGTLFGGSIYVTGVSGKGVQFDGVDDYINWGDNADLELGTRSLTLSYWINYLADQPESYLGEYLGAIIGKGQLGPVDGYGGHISNNFTCFQVRTVATPKSVCSDIALNDGNWHHIAAVVNRTGNLSLYIDGILQLKQQSISSWSGTDLSNAEDFLAGTRDAGAYQFDYRGRLDEVMVFNRGLSSQEIQALYNSQKPVVTLSLSPFVKFWEWLEELFNLF